MEKDVVPQWRRRRRRGGSFLKGQTIMKRETSLASHLRLLHDQDEIWDQRRTIKPDSWLIGGAQLSFILNCPIGLGPDSIGNIITGKSAEM